MWESLILLWLDTAAFWGLRVPRPQLSLALSGLITSRGAKRLWNIQKAEQISSPWLSVSRRSSVTRKSELLLEDQFFTWSSSKLLKPSRPKSVHFCTNICSVTWQHLMVAELLFCWNGMKCPSLIVFCIFLKHTTPNAQCPINHNKTFFSWNSQTCDLYHKTSNEAYTVLCASLD